MFELIQRLGLDLYSDEGTLHQDFAFETTHAIVFKHGFFKNIAFLFLWYQRSNDRFDLLEFGLQ